MFEKQKISLGTFPTPLQRLTRFPLANPLYIKRDDLSDPGLGGNKLRKLEYLVQAALDQGCDTLLTVGGPQTNHGRLTAAVAAKLGLKCVLVLTGDEPEVLSANLVLDLFLGAEVIFQGSRDLDELIEETQARYSARGHKVYPIPLGGSNATGAMGYFSMMQELSEQMHSQDILIDHLVITAGSLGTLAGIVLGKKYFQLPMQIHGIKIFSADPDADNQLLLDMAQQASQQFGLGLNITADDFTIHTHSGTDPYYQLGYNVPDPKTRGIIQKLARSEGIILDPTYTGKGFLGMLDLIERRVIAPEESVLFVHTGGSPSLFSYEHLMAMQPELKQLLQDNRLK